MARNQMEGTESRGERWWRWRSYAKVDVAARGSSDSGMLDEEREKEGKETTATRVCTASSGIS